MNRSTRYAKPITVYVGAGVAALVLAACSSSGSSTASGSSSAAIASASSAPASSAPAVGAPASSRAAAESAAIAVKTGPLGAYLTDGAGRTLYLFTPDKTTASTCYGNCAAAWPAFTTSGAPTASGAAASGTIATSKRTDGTLQVTYDGHPLYYFADDTSAGDTKGQGVGGVWFEVAPGGKSLGAPAALPLPRKSATPATAKAAAATASPTEDKPSDTREPAESDHSTPKATPSATQPVAGGWS
jgi:predicted lipoprotein with Yx(FWY)xxD motif